MPEIICLNSHDGRSALQFRLGLYRPICTNGLIVCDSTLPAWRLPHRGNVLDDAIAAVIAQSELFADVGRWVERMEQSRLDEPQRLTFAQEALSLRFPRTGISACTLANCSRRGGRKIGVMIYGASITSCKKISSKATSLATRRRSVASGRDRSDPSDVMWR